MASHDIQPHWQEDFKRLTILLNRALSNAPVVVFISVEDQLVEKVLISALREQFPDVRMPSFGFERYAPSLRTYLSRYAPTGTQVVIARGIDRLPDRARQTALQTLNRERDVLGEFGCSFLIFLTPEIAPDFSRWAADFWDCGSTYLEFPAPERRRSKARLLTARQDYLRALQARFSQVELRGILPVSGSPQVDLAAIFVEPSVIVHRESRRFQDEQSAEPESLLFRKLLKPHQRMVILGAPGAGKSMLLRYIAMLLAQGPVVVGQSINIDTNIDWFPILLPLSSYSATLIDQPNLTISDYIPIYLASRELGTLEMLPPLLRGELQKGRGVVMLDGLDEIAIAGQRHGVIERIRDFVQRFPENIYLITSRIAGYDRASVGEEFGLLTIAELEWSQQNKLIRKWCQVTSSSSIEDETITASINDQSAIALAERLVAMIEREPYFSALSSNPLLLTILINVYLRGESLPRRRGELYRITTAALIETWSLERSVSGRPVWSRLDNQILDERRVVELLGPLAFWLHQSRSSSVITQHELIRRLADYMTQREGMPRDRAWRVAEEFATVVQEKMGVLVEREPGKFTFIHRTFQEYLSARYLATRRDVDTLSTELLADPKWEEVLVLVGDILQGEYFDDYIRTLLGVTLDGPAVGQNTVIAGRCLYSVGSHLTGTDLGQDVIAELSQLVETPDIPLQRRLKGGEVLGNLGDPRTDQMIRIPAGPFTMGITDADLTRYSEPGPLQRLLKRSASAHEVYVPEFYIDRYPVTHAQYARFIEDEGYTRQELWSEEGWQWLNEQRRKEPGYWHEYRWNRPNYPVISVSWYEAEAYARWADKRLPTEAEYEKAARGTDLRMWPWGNNWQKDAANAEAQIGQLAPVGVYPKGRSPYGVMDMAGNVWEWVADWFAHYDAPEQKNLHSKVLRGGAWNSDREQLRCVVRLMSDPGARVGSVGFRCAIDSSEQGEK
jgi:formylglycine-generating enzyme required for sulfatase activity